MSLKTLKDYMEAGKYGRRLSLAELRALTEEERAYFDAALAEVGRIPFDVEQDT